MRLRRFAFTVLMILSISAMLFAGGSKENAASASGLICLPILPELLPDPSAGLLIAVGIYAVGIYHGAYIAEVVRAGIQSIPKGQAEAAASQGFTYVQTMRWIILPQTIKIILPPLVNQMVNLIKNTSVIALIGGTDLMNRTNDWATTGECIYGPPFLVCGILYFILCFPLATWGRNYEERLKKRDIQSTDKPASTGEAAS